VRVTLPTSEWDGLRLVERLTGGHRNEVWSGMLGETPVAVRRSRRSPTSLRWELDLLVELARRGFHVAEPIATSDGSMTHNATVVQRWVDGRDPSSDADWTLVAAELGRLHDDCRDVEQRPGCCAVTELVTQRRSVDADLDQVPPDAATLLTDVFEELVDVPISLIHGDPDASNIRIDDHDRVWLLDWDESRVDVVWHDLSNLGVPVLKAPDHKRAQRLSDAWEALNAWTSEPDYARSRLAELRKRT
jgi:Ser/Thr protein kinase RdoA (MazF antagonist)